jgi:hypothetical protein
MESVCPASRRTVTPARQRPGLCAHWSDEALRAAGPTTRRRRGDEDDPGGARHVLAAAKRVTSGD